MVNGPATIEGRWQGFGGSDEDTHGYEQERTRLAATWLEKEAIGKKTRQTSTYVFLFRIHSSR